jgi:light-regulated signal transduction histidine kinase (bacteriophytochrome)
LDPDADDFIGLAVEGATRMQQLINDLLTYSRVGTQGKPFGPTDLEMAFESALANLQIAIDESKAVITHEPLPILLADHVQMVQLFQNLIGNAIKFRGPAPARIRVRAHPIDSGWQFSVIDNGIGIDPQFNERIFVIFQRLHTRAEYQGTGIGLAICKKIVERHGGNIWVEPAPDQGSVFHFTMAERGGMHDS